MTLPSPNTSLSSASASTLPSPLAQFSNGLKFTPSAGFELVIASHSRLPISSVAFGNPGRDAAPAWRVPLRLPSTEICFGPARELSLGLPILIWRLWRGVALRHP